MLLPILGIFTPMSLSLLHYEHLCVAPYLMGNKGTIPVMIADYQCSYRSDPGTVLRRARIDHRLEHTVHPNPKSDLRRDRVD